MGATDFRVLLHQFLSAFIKEAAERPVECYLASCRKPSILSHSFQRASVLNRLQEGGVVFAIRPRRQEDQPTNNEVSDFVFRTPISQAGRFKGFCKLHDTAVFKPIETAPMSRNVYKYILLNAYRGFAYAHTSEKLLHDQTRGLQDTKYFKNTIRDHPRIAPFAKTQYESAVRDIQTRAALAYPLERWDLVQERFEEIIDSSDPDYSETRVAKSFCVEYLPIPIDLYWAALAGADLVLPGRGSTSSHPVCVGLLPQCDSWKPLFFFVCLQEEAKLHEDLLEKLRWQKRQPQPDATVYLLLQDLLLFLSGDIVMAPKLHRWLAQQGMSELLKQYWEDVTVPLGKGNPPARRLGEWRGFCLFPPLPPHGSLTRSR
ncbi:MAG: hypothetical protein LBI33_04695 [Propionibacteriaceae bacterium]|jgi:hypothetical protein|nr:hypothetical protein [Propionibacteriaceae bacterium]